MLQQIPSSSTQQYNQQQQQAAAPGPQRPASPNSSALTGVYSNTGFDMIQVLLVVVGVQKPKIALLILVLFQTKSNNSIGTY
jgi:hypothetical protein